MENQCLQFQPYPVLNHRKGSKVELIPSSHSSRVVGCMLGLTDEGSDVTPGVDVAPDDEDDVTFPA